MWLTLYTLMGISLFIVWQTRAGTPGRKKNAIIIVFAVQLFLNAIWSIVFFGMHSIGGALAVIVLLWLAIIANIIVFYNISKTAGVLLIPYLAWVSFAVLLNASLLSL